MHDTELIRRFNAKINKDGDCWHWTGSVNGAGYGQITYKNKHHGVHRLSWEIANGREAPKGYDIAHQCDDRKCINPSHLFLATRRENIADAIKKQRPFGRSPAGMRRESPITL